MPKVQDTNETEYLAAVEEGKAIIADVSGKQWALGDLALKVEKKYGENRLEQFAVDINYDGETSTLSRYRSVCLAFPKTGGRPRFFASAQILQGRDDRFQIVTANPDISVREARELMRKPTSAENKVNSGGKGAKANGTKTGPNGEQKLEWSSDISGWFNKQVADVRTVINELNKTRENCKREQHDLLATLEPTLLLEEFQKGEKTAAEFVEWVATSLEKAADKLTKKGRVRIIPAPKPARRASAQAQPSV